MNGVNLEQRRSHSLLGYIGGIAVCKPRVMITLIRSVWAKPQLEPCLQGIADKRR